MLQIKIHKILSVIVLMTTLLLAPALWAQSAGTADEAIAIALEQNGGQGKVLGVREKSADDGNRFYQIKLLLDGKVRFFKIRKQ